MYSSNTNQRNTPKVSICIPAYKQRELLDRCLDSIQRQTFTNYEVIITDDTPNGSIGELAQLYASKMKLHYYKNTVALGSPKNWNEGLRKASGEYIKIMHQDDWFAQDNALATFVEILDKNPGCNFAFSFCSDVVDGKPLPPNKNVAPAYHASLINKNVLLTYNFVGAPSTTIFRNHQNIWFDERMKWCVDFDFYMQLYQQKSKVLLIGQVLLHIGIHEGQVTNTVIRDANVVVYENLLLLNKYNVLKLNIGQYDFYWRMLRNYDINKSNLQAVIKEQPIPPIINKIISWQNALPKSLLKLGAVSKLWMGCSYLVR